MVIDPDNAELKINLGTIEFYKGNYDSAKTILLDVVKSEKVDPNAFNTLALISVEEKKYDEALDFVNRALRIQPGDAYFLNNRGYVYLMMNDLPKAIEDINESIITDPYNGWAYRNKGIYFLKTSKVDEAIRMFQQAEKRETFIQDIAFWFGEAYWMKGDKSTACEYYKKSIDNRERKIISAGRC
jgi:tetratricopeptide (TPR) repeat protein